MTTLLLNKTVLRLPVRHAAVALAAVVLGIVSSPRPLLAVSCTTQSQMEAVGRGQLYLAAKKSAEAIISGSDDTLKADVLSQAQAQFAGIASAAHDISPTLKGASFSAQSLYILDARDLTAPGPVQFFCNAPGSNLNVSFNFGELPPGRFALALLHADGVSHPQQLSVLMGDEKKHGASDNSNADWKLAGFFTRPLMRAGHDGVWYWTEARRYADNQQVWPAYLLYETATTLLVPVDFLSSPNRDKLEAEQAKIAPQPLADHTPVKVGGANAKPWQVSNLRTDDSMGGLDLVMNYTYSTVPGGPTDPPAVSADATAMMKTFINEHPDLRTCFRGLWAFVEVPGQSVVSLELTMDKLH